jgi:hypothetical protein
MMDSSFDSRCLHLLLAFVAHDVALAYRNVSVIERVYRIFHVPGSSRVPATSVQLQLATATVQGVLHGRYTSPPNSVVVM